MHRGFVIPVLFCVVDIGAKRYKSDQLLILQQKVKAHTIKFNYNDVMKYYSKWDILLPRKKLLPSNNLSWQGPTFAFAMYCVGSKCNSQHSKKSGIATLENSIIIEILRTISLAFYLKDYYYNFPGKNNNSFSSSSLLSI